MAITSLAQVKSFIDTTFDGYDLQTPPDEMPFIANLSKSQFDELAVYARSAGLKVGVKGGGPDDEGNYTMNFRDADLNSFISLAYVIAEEGQRQLLDRGGQQYGGWNIEDRGLMPFNINANGQMVIDREAVKTQLQEPVYGTYEQAAERKKQIEEASREQYVATQTPSAIGRIFDPVGPPTRPQEITQTEKGFATQPASQPETQTWPNTDAGRKARDLEAARRNEASLATGQQWVGSTDDLGQLTLVQQPIPEQVAQTWPYTAEGLRDRNDTVNAWNEANPGLLATGQQYVGSIDQTTGNLSIILTKIPTPKEADTTKRTTDMVEAQSWVAEANDLLSVQSESGGPALMARFVDYGNNTYGYEIVADTSTTDLSKFGSAEERAEYMATLAPDMLSGIETYQEMTAEGPVYGIRTRLPAKPGEAKQRYDDEIWQLLNSGDLDKAMRMDSLRDAIDAKRITYHEAANLFAPIAETPEEFTRWMNTVTDMYNQPSGLGMPSFGSGASGPFRGSGQVSRTGDEYAFRQPDGSFAAGGKFSPELVDALNMKLGHSPVSTGAATGENRRTIADQQATYSAMGFEGSMGAPQTDFSEEQIAQFRGADPFTLSLSQLRAAGMTENGVLKPEYRTQANLGQVSSDMHAITRWFDSAVPGSDTGVPFTGTMGSAANGASKQIVGDPGLWALLSLEQRGEVATDDRTVKVLKPAFTKEDEEKRRAGQAYVTARIDKDGNRVAGTTFIPTRKYFGLDTEKKKEDDITYADARFEAEQKAKAQKAQTHFMAKGATKTTYS